MAPTSKTRIVTDGGATTAHNQPPTVDETMRARHAKVFERLNVWKAKAEKAVKKTPKTQADCAALDALYLEGRDIRNDADALRTKEGKEPFELYSAINTVFNQGVRDVVGSEAGRPGLANRLKQAAADQRLALTRAEQQRAKEESDRLEAKRLEQEQAAAATAKRGDNRIAEVQQAGADALGADADRLDVFASKPLAEASKVTVGGVTASADSKWVCQGVNRAELDLPGLLPYIKSDTLIEAVNAYLKQTQEKSFKGAVVTEVAVGRVRRA